MQDGQIESLDALEQIQIPNFIFFFFPVFLALFCLTLSLSGHSVYTGFSENDAGTWMSLFLMFVVFLLAIPAVKSIALSKGHRIFASALAGVTALAMLDERVGLHEDIGKYAQKHISFLPKVVLHYTDDLIILFGAIIVSFVLYRCLKLFAKERDIWPYLICVVVMAVAHGVLDLISHRHYIWQLIWPDIQWKDIRWTLLERLGYFEEFCKIGCEWFVVLFMMRFFYKKEVYLNWSILIFLSSLLAVFGLWSLQNIELGVPYITMGVGLKYIRNYSLLFVVCLHMTIWAAAIWYRFKNEVPMISKAGLFLTLPYYILLPHVDPYILSFGLLILSIGSLVFLSYLTQSRFGLVQKNWGSVVVLTLIFSLVLSCLFVGPLIPNTKFKVHDKIFLQTGYQPIAK